MIAALDDPPAGLEMRGTVLRGALALVLGRAVRLVAGIAGEPSVAERTGMSAERLMAVSPAWLDARERRY